MKKCLYCDSELNQHESYKECLSCKFPINGTVNDAKKYLEQKFKKAITVYFVVLGGLAVTSLALGSFMVNGYTLLIWGGILAYLIWDKHNKEARFNK